MKLAIDEDPEFFHGLTLWTTSISMQMRDNGAALVIRPEAVISSEYGSPAILDKPELRRIRDLLNVATARGAL